MGPTLTASSTPALRRILSMTSHERPPTTAPKSARSISEERVFVESFMRRAL